MEKNTYFHIDCNESPDIIAANFTCDFLKIMIQWGGGGIILLRTVTMVRDFQKEPNFQEMCILICFMS